MRCGWAFILAAVLSAGCLETSPPADIGSPTQRLPQPLGLVVSEPVEVRGARAIEPAIERAPDGALWVAGQHRGEIQQPAPLWKSLDSGATWSRIDVGAPEDGAIGWSDVELAVAPDGTVYFAMMTFYDVGVSIVVGASTDGGSSWTWRPLCLQPFADRPWIEVASDGTAHAVWNDGVVVRHAVSRDRGATWVEGVPVHAPGGDGMLAIGPDGELAVRILPTSGGGWTGWGEEQDGVAISTDGGVSWTFRALPGDRSYATDQPFRWADPIAFDVAGTLYASWGEGSRLFLGHSTDLGESWRVTPIATVDGVAAYPSLRSGREPGVVAASWQTWDEKIVRGHVGLVEAADTEAPRVRQGSFEMVWVGEYFQLAFLTDAVLAFPVTLWGEDDTQETSGFEFRTAQ